MSRWIHMAAALYPAPWRARYGAEFHALLEDAHSGRGDFFDVLRGAFIMQITSGRLLRMLVPCGLAGALIAAAIVFATATPYRATAVLTAPAGATYQVVEQMRTAEQMAFSRASLGEIILRPGINLYAAERRRLPLEDIVEGMRRDLHVTWREPGRRPPQAVVEFRYPDATKARLALVAMSQRLAEEGQSGFFRFSELRVTPQGRNWLWLAEGLAAGLAFGALLAWFGANNRRWRWRMVLFGFAGAAVASALSFLIPDQYVATGKVRFPGGMPVQSLLWNRGFTVRDLPPAGSGAYQISYLGPDREKAQLAVRNAMTLLVERHYQMFPGRPSPEIIDPASLPEVPVSPNRIVILCAGIALAWIAGAWQLRSHPIQGVPAPA